MAFEMMWQHGEYAYGVWQWFVHNCVKMQNIDKIKKWHFCPSSWIWIQTVVFVVLPAKTPPSHGVPQSRKHLETTFYVCNVVCTYARIYGYMHAYLQYMRPYTQMCAHIYIYADRYAYVHTYTHTCISAHMNSVPLCTTSKHHRRSIPAELSHQIRSRWTIPADSS